MQRKKCFTVLTYPHHICCQWLSIPQTAILNHAEFYNSCYWFPIDLYGEKYIGIILVPNCAGTPSFNLQQFAVSEKSRGEKMHHLALSHPINPSAHLIWQEPQVPISKDIRLSSLISKLSFSQRINAVKFCSPPHKETEAPKKLYFGRVFDDFKAYQVTSEYLRNTTLYRPVLLLWTISLVD